MSEVLIYATESGQTHVSVRLDAETVWLTQEQMAALFGRERSVVTKHLRNVFKEGELDATATCAKFAHVQNEGGRSVTRDIEYYNLDVIISVGYRVKSTQGVQFRQWATRTLREHLVQGYTLNSTRLAERGIDEAQQAIELLARTLNNQALVSDTGSAVLALIVDYAKTWRLLLQYDESGLVLPESCQPAQSALDLAKALAAIAKFKAELMARGEATPLFGQARGEAFEGILGNIEQSMFGESLYRTREEKAAHLLYFIIKDHPFSDGNKRIGSFMFLLYLQQENMSMSINENALTALALLIAESDPVNKELMIRLVVNLLADGA
jgi:prophage maintenance system killer protein